VSIIPCEQNQALRIQIERFAEVLKTEAHTLGAHGLDEKDFYNSGLFRGAVERVRGQFSSTMRGKREFAQHALNHMEDGGFILGWDLTEGPNRNDYVVRLTSGRTAVIALKGCLDGNNTNIFERPLNADEFVIWSICTNLGADPRRNAWSGIHTRLSAEMISRHQRVDGVVIWDMVCGTLGRPCPKLQRPSPQERRTDMGPFSAPPACIYVFPHAIPSRQHPRMSAQDLSAVELLSAFHACFRGWDDEVNYVDFEIATYASELCRRTRVRRGGVVQHESEMTPIRRV
jgi:hypothetical protein